MSQTYSEAIAMCLDMAYTPCAKFSREQTGDIFIFAQIKEGSI